MTRKQIFVIFILFTVIVSNGLIYTQWSKLNTTGNVPHLKNASAIYDPAGNRMIVYGGRTEIGITNSMYSLNLNDNTWSLINQIGGPIPSPRYTHNAYFDLNTNSMIIWSGQGLSSSLFNDVWVFSFSSHLWNRLWLDSNVSGAPLKRYGTASVFEPVSRKFTTFAGFTTSGRFDDTWTFDVSSMTWQDRTNSQHPPKRCLHSAVYASELGKFVIYAGQDDAGIRDDIWECNLSNYSWSDITPVVKPPARFWNSIIYYYTSPPAPLLKGEGSGSILIFGGLNNTARNDMWKFRMGSNLWESVNQGSVIPPARWGHAGIYIPAQDRMIIFGGEGDSLYTDTWQYSNVSVIGIEPVNQNIPKEFSLEQNYPNPFNPVTKIKFQTPLSDRSPSDNPPEGGKLVKLIVYDVTGKVIKILVNQNLKAGVYEVVFDSGNLPSGVYFYQLTSGSFKVTRKMVLLK